MFQVGNGTTKWNTECLCTHLTSFGGDFAVPPNTIDFSNVWAKFANLNENAAVFSTVVALIGVYIMLLIWSRYMDKRDIIKVSQTPHTLFFFICMYKIIPGKKKYN